MVSNCIYWPDDYHTLALQRSGDDVKVFLFWVPSTSWVWVFGLRVVLWKRRKEKNWKVCMEKSFLEIYTNSTKCLFKTFFSSFFTVLHTWATYSCTIEKRSFVEEEDKGVIWNENIWKTCLSVAAVSSRKWKILWAKPNNIRHRCTSCLGSYRFPLPLLFFLRFPPSDEKQKPFLCVVNKIIFILIENDEKRIFISLFLWKEEKKNCEKSKTIFPWFLFLNNEQWERNSIFACLFLLFVRYQKRWWRVDDRFFSFVVAEVKDRMKWKTHSEELQKLNFTDVKGKSIFIVFAFNGISHIETNQTVTI